MLGFEILGVLNQAAGFLDGACPGNIVLDKTFSILNTLTNMVDEISSKEDAENDDDKGNGENYDYP